ncbi:DUF6688 family protein [Paradesertivirga mongoliensis]|uniref:DUF6688 family protein n=1 Tax=Paradesertivirga mongoliensis TaxID=2100740 RepID=A0ABW4ZLX8_9SPHI|nr:DUF6688 family protein [Pedobacter mongoliensis]
MEIFILILSVPSFLVLHDFVYYCSGKTGWMSSFWLNAIGFVYVIILPWLFLSNTETYNNCCTESAFFSLDHRLTPIILIVLCMIAYLYSSWRTELAPPLTEVLINCFLVIAVVLNVFIGLQHKEIGFFFVMHVPIVLHFLIQIAKNQLLFLSETDLSTYEIKSTGEKIAVKVLKLTIFKKIPLLILLCFPVLGILIAFLLLFGQKPDSIVRAFTDTYKHGFSQLDDQCLNSICPGGHFLNTIAAKGHNKLVKPIRLGRRAGNIIICNRQLLISNAFEDLLQRKLPGMHKPIRKVYNRIGGLIHRYYGAFNHKWVSDSIYILMKPLEWFFLIVLYLFDKKPENRIASQYIDKNECQNLIKQIIHD